LRAARPPAAIVLNISDPVVDTLVAWIRAQRNAIADIPIVGIGARSRAPLYPTWIDAAVTAPTVALLEDALGRAMTQPPRGVD
jgi:hypothetical protein